MGLSRVYEYLVRPKGLFKFTDNSSAHRGDLPSMFYEKDSLGDFALFEVLAIVVERNNQVYSHGSKLIMLGVDGPFLVKKSAISMVCDLGDTRPFNAYVTDFPVDTWWRLRGGKDQMFGYFVDIKRLVVECFEESVNGV